MLKYLAVTILLSCPLWAQDGTGSSSINCTPPTYCAYTGTDVKPWPTVPDMGKQLNSGLKWTDPNLPGTISSPVVRCTDQSIEPNSAIANQSKSVGLGGGAKEQLFNFNSTMLRINTSGGRGHITLFNKTTMKCGDPVSGYVITNDKNTAGGGSPTTDHDFGSGSFSWTDSETTAGNSVYYGFNSGNDAPAFGFAKYVISQTDGTFTVTTPFLSLQNGLPIGTQVLAWQSAHGYSTGGYVSFTLTLPNWSGAGSPIVGDLIKPLSNNAAGCAFKLVTAGTRGTQPPSWSTGSSCQVSQNFTEGGAQATWKNIGNNGTFLFQCTANCGTSGGSAPNFATASGHPDLGSTISDNGMTWTNVGVDIVPFHVAFGGVSKDSTRFCAVGSWNTYGGATIPGGYTSNNGGQDTDVVAVCYDSATSAFAMLNSVTGFQSNVTCTGGGTGYTCAGGSQTKPVAQATPVAAIASGCPFFIHNIENFSTADNVLIALKQSISPMNGSTFTCPVIASGQNVLMRWHPFAAYNATTVLQAFNTASNHQSAGNHLLTVYGQSSLNFGFTTGVYAIQLDSSNPGGSAVTSWQVGPPFTATCDGSGVWFPLDAHPPCSFPSAYDSHLAPWHDSLDDDLGPDCGTMYDSAEGYANEVAPYQGEAVCVSKTPTWTPPAVIGAYKVNRFTHTFVTLTNPFFDSNFVISQLSTDGKFLAFTSDWDCTLGDISGNATNNCGLIWHPSTFYTNGTFVNPFQSLSGSGTNFGVWKVTANGTSQVSSTWGGGVCSAGNAGTNFTDASGLTYQCVGTGNAKAEVFIVNLSPSMGLIPTAPTFLRRVLQ